MAQGSSAITASTASRLVIDGGVLYKNIDVTSLEDGTATTPVADALASGTLIAATRGGNTFTAGRTMREMEADGKLGPTKGFKRRQSVEATLSTNLLEITPAVLTDIMAGATVTTAGAFEKITGGPVETTDYLDNIALVATHTNGTDDTDAVVIVLENVLATEFPEFSFTDEDELVLPVTFGAHFDPASPDTEPYAIYISSSVS